MHLIVIILTQFLHRFLDIVVIGILEVVIYLRFFVGIHHLFDEIVDVDLRTAEDDRLQFVHHLFHRHAVALRQIVQIDATVDRLDDLFFTGRFLGYGANTQVFGANNLIHILLDDLQELVAIAFGFGYADARDEQQLLHGDRVGSCHRLQTRILEDDERRHIVFLRYLTADILQDRVEHLVCCGTSGSCAVHHIFVFVLHLDRHFELTRFANEFQSVFLQLQVAVRIDIFLDHSYQQRLT